MKSRLAIATLIASGCLAAGVVPAAQVAFSDQTVAAGLSFTPDSPGDMDHEAMYPGGSVADFNKDGWPDLFVLGCGNVADALFINNGNGTFTDEAAAWGLADTHRGRGTTVGDFNNDGWPDIFITSGGDMTGVDRFFQHRLYRNNGNGTFTDIAGTAGVTNTSAYYLTATGAAFGDYDLDGDLDLFVGGWENFACSSGPCDQNRMFKNNGDETFTDVTMTVGGDFFQIDGFSPRFVDMNGDHYPELLVAADFGTSRYYINDQDGTFTDAIATSGTGFDTNGMGSTVGDFNPDGLADWYVTSIHRDGMGAQDGNYLYINQGNHVYSVNPDISGAKDGGWGWGTEAVDFDHDGWIDLAETNGWYEPEFVGEQSYLFRNNGDLTFTEVQVGSGFDHTDDGRSLLTLDYDRDGDMDIVITSWSAPLRLFRNDVTGSDAHWLEIRLNTDGDPVLAPEGYGSRVVITVSGVSQYFWINGGASYLGRSQPVAHFGLGTATIVDQLTVEWANGSTTVLTNVPADQILTIASAGSGSPPGEPTLQASYNKGTGEIDVDYTPGCDASDHTIYYGDLADVATYGYAGATCSAGISGSASFDPGPNDTFFLIVATSGAAEGSYGVDGNDVERPEDTLTPGCDLAQDLGATCGP
jgi:hypothetical protein